jgi:SAM-dependent methyltransferase
LGDAGNLQEIPDGAFDVVFFPLNAIDYTDTYQERERNILEAGKKLRKGGLFAFTSHNKMAYAFSPKVSWKDRSLRSFTQPYTFARESAVGGGVLFKGNPSFIIADTERMTGYRFAGFVCDTRNKWDRFLARKQVTAQLVFPYVLYVFRKG